MSRAVASSASAAEPAPHFLAIVSFARLVVSLRRVMQRRVAEEIPPSWNAANWPKINAGVERLSLLLCRTEELCLLFSPLQASRLVTARFVCLLFSFRVTRSATTIGFPTVGDDLAGYATKATTARLWCILKIARGYTRGTSFYGNDNEPAAPTVTGRLLRVFYLKGRAFLFRKKSTPRLDLETGSWLMLAFPIMRMQTRVRQTYTTKTRDVTVDI